MKIVFNLVIDFGAKRYQKIANSMRLNVGRFILLDDIVPSAGARIVRS